MTVPARIWLLSTKRFDLMDDLESIKKLALKGDPDAPYRMGRSYELGEGIEQDHKER